MGSFDEQDSQSQAAFNTGHTESERIDRMLGMVDRIDKLSDLKGSSMGDALPPAMKDDSPKSDSLPDTLPLGAQSQSDHDGNQDDDEVNEVPNETPPTTECAQPDEDTHDKQEVAEPAPKKKRVYLRDLTPKSKEVEVERRKQAKRDNSNKWHSEWASKGVPKGGTADDSEVGTTGPGDDDCDDEGPGPSNSSGSMPTGGPETPQGTIFQPDQELMEMAQSNDMRKVRFSYINKFLEWRASDSKDDQTVAQKAWLDSDLRAQMVAAKKKKQY
eukprot:s204_g11.t1